MEEFTDNDLLNMDFEVENVLGSRLTEDGIEYNIKWKGFPDSENTWEKEKDLLHDALLERVKEKMAEIGAAAKKKDELQARRLRKHRNRIHVAQKTGVGPLASFVAEKTMAGARSIAKAAAKETTKVAKATVNYGVALGKFHALLATELSKGGYKYAKRSAKKVVKAVKDATKKAPGQGLRAIAELARLQKEENKDRRKLPFGVPNLSGVFARVETKVNTFSRTEAASVHAKLNDALLKACGQVLEPVKQKGDEQYMNAMRIKKQMELIEKITKSRDKITDYYQEKKAFEAKRQGERFDLTAEALAGFLDRLAFIADQKINNVQGPVAKNKEFVLKKDMSEAVKHVYTEILRKLDLEKTKCQNLVDEFKDFVASDPRLANGTRLEKKQKNDIACMIAITMLRVHDAKNGEQYSYDFGKITAAVPDAYDVNLTNFCSNFVNDQTNKDGWQAAFSGLEGAIETLYVVPWLKGKTEWLNNLTSVQFWSTMVGGVGSVMLAAFGSGSSAAKVGAWMSQTGEKAREGAQYTSNRLREFVNIICNLFLGSLAKLNEQLEAGTGGSTFWWLYNATKYVGQTAIYTKFWLSVQVVATNIFFNCFPSLLVMGGSAVMPYALQIMNLFTGTLIIALRKLILSSGALGDRKTLKRRFENLQNNIMQKKNITDKDEKELQNILVLRSKNASYGADYVARLLTVSNRDYGWYLWSPIWSSLSILGGGSWLYSLIGIGSQAAAINYGGEEYAAVCTHNCEYVQVMKIGNSTDVKKLSRAEAEKAGIKFGDGDKLPSQAYEKLTQEYTAVKFLVAKMANEEMSKGTWSGMFNALQIQWMAGDDTTVNNVVNTFVQSPFAPLGRGLNSASNNFNFPSLKLLGKGQMKSLNDFLDDKQKKREKEEKKKATQKAWNDLKEYKKEEVGKRKRTKLLELQDRVNNLGIQEERDPKNTIKWLGSSINDEIQANQRQSQEQAQKVITNAMDELLDATGYTTENSIFGARKLPGKFNKAKPSTEAEEDVAKAFKKLPVKKRIELKAKLEQGVKECNRLIDECRLDRRSLGYYENTMTIPWANWVFDIGRFLGYAPMRAPMFDLIENQPSDFTKTANETGSQNATWEEAKSSASQGEAEQSTETQMTAKDLQFANQALKDNAFQFYNRPLLDWLSDPSNQEKVVQKAIADAENAPSNEAFQTFENAQKAMDKARAKSTNPETTKALKDELAKETDFRKIADEMNFENPTSDLKTSEDVKQMLRDAGGDAAKLRDVNNKLGKLRDNYERRVQAGNDPNWDGWQQEESNNGMNTPNVPQKRLPTNPMGPALPVSNWELAMLPPRRPKQNSSMVVGRLGVRRIQRQNFVEIKER